MIKINFFKLYFDISLQHNLATLANCVASDVQRDGKQAFALLFSSLQKKSEHVFPKYVLAFHTAYSNLEAHL